MTVIGASEVIRGLRRRLLRSRAQHTPPPAASATPRQAISTPLPLPLELPPLVVVPAWVAELSAGVAVRCVVEGATAPCGEEATVGVGRVTEEDADPSGVAEAAGPEAEADGEGEVAEGEAEVGEGEGEVGEGEGEEEVCVGVGDGD